MLSNLAQLEINQYNGQSHTAYIYLVATSAESTGPLIRGESQTKACCLGALRRKGKGAPVPRLAGKNVRLPFYARS